MESRYWASRPQTGLADPDYVRIGQAYGLKTITISNNLEIRDRIRQVLDSRGPVLCNVEFSQNQRIIPMLKAGRPIEDSSPLLDRKEFTENMIVAPLDTSLTME